MNISAPFIQRPVMTTLCLLAIICAGLIAYEKLPVSDLPAVQYPKISVHTEYAGASPEAVLDTVTIPLEKELATVKGVKEMSSYSTQGHSNISLSFDLHKNMEETVQDVLAALHHAEGQLPENLTQRPTYFREEKNQEPIMSILVTSSSWGMGELRSFADIYLLPRLKRIEGVAQAVTFGSEKEIWLKVNPELLAARNIGFNQIIDTVRSHTSQNALGSIQTGTKTYRIELSKSLQSPKEIEELQIQNTPLRIRDVALVSEESDEHQEFHYVTQEAILPTVVINIQKTSDGNTVAISDAVKELLASCEKEMPKEIQLGICFNKADWIMQSILDVKYSLLIAFVLVLLVIYCSLGKVRDALIPSVALPISLLGTFSVMYLLGYSIDLLSLLALTLSVGFVVDDAIVVLENIVRHQEKGKSALAASLDGSKEISFTILSITLSLVAVFIPLLFMPGVNGKLFREFSMTLACAILVSGIISLTLTPMLCSRFLSSQKRVVTNSHLVALYGKTLKVALRYPKTILTCAILCMGVTIPLYTQLPVQLIPPEDRGIVWAACSLPSGISSSETKRHQARLEKLFQGDQYVESFFDFTMGNHLIFFLKLVPLGERPSQDHLVGEFKRKLDTIVGITSFVHPYQLININMEFGTMGAYRYDLHGFNADEVDAASRALALLMRTHPEFSSVDLSMQEDHPRLILHTDYELAHNFGLSKAEIQDVLESAFGKSQIATFYRGGRQEKIYVQLLPEHSKNSSNLANLLIRTDEGKTVPMKAFTTFEEQMSKPGIERDEQLPSASVYFTLSESVAPNIGLQAFEEEAKKSLPANVKGSLGGLAKRIASAMHDTLLLLLAAALVMYIVLGILYESFIHPLTILSSLPFAGLGGILTLSLFGEPISIFSAVGFLLLIGIVKKNGIMVVDYAITARHHGKTAEEAIYEGSLIRFRPIMMTTLAAIMGALPIAIGLGEGAEMRRGLGLVIVGGLCFSQILTLYVTPIVYLFFEKLRPNPGPNHQS